VAEVAAHVDDGAGAPEPRRASAASRTPIKASWQSEARLRFAGKGMRPGQIEALCAKVGLR
jgi:hypothetical protein